MRKKIRIIGRLDVKAPNLVKGVNLEGVRVVGAPEAFAQKYCQSGVDELIYMDCVASLYGRNTITEIVKKTAGDIYIPLTVGGGLRSLNDVDSIMAAGADKVAMNTAAISHPELISQIASKYGSQAMVLSIEAKSVGQGQWEAYVDNGREKTALNVIDWARQAVELGAGEILLTSVDRDGTNKGFDVELIAAVSRVVCVPLIASGGMGCLEHALPAADAGADALAIASAFHYEKFSAQGVVNYLEGCGFEVVRHDNSSYL